MFSFVRSSVPPGPSKLAEARYFVGSPTEAAMPRTCGKLNVNQFWNSAGLLWPVICVKYWLSVVGCHTLSG